MKYLNFELKRIVNNKKNKIICVILGILMILLIFFSSNLKSSNNYKTTENDLEISITSSRQALNSLNGDDTVPDNVKNEIKKDLEDVLNLYNQQKESLQKKDLTLYYQIQLKINKIYEQTGQATEYTSEQNAYIKDVSDKKIDFEFSPKAQLHSFGLVHEILFALLFSSLSYLIILLFGGISIASDFENESMKLYKTPIFHKKNSVMSHFLTNVFSAIVFYTTIVLVYLLGTGLLNGFGSLKYPSGINGLALLDNWKIDIIYLFWGFLVITFIISLGILLSLLVRRSLIVVGIFVFLILGFEMIKSQEFMKPFLKFIPMSYFEPIKLLQGGLDLTTSPIVVGLIYLATSSFLFVVISVFMYNRISFREISSNK